MIPLPRPASPRALWRDLRSVFGSRSPHQLIAAFLALLIPAAIGVTFYLDNIDAHEAGPQVIYVESWSLNRTNEEIVAKQVADEKHREAWDTHRREQFQRLQNGMNDLGI